MSCNLFLSRPKTGKLAQFFCIFGVLLFAVTLSHVVMHQSINQNMPFCQSSPSSPTGFVRFGAPLPIVLFASRRVPLPCAPLALRSPPASVARMRRSSRWDRSRHEICTEPRDSTARPSIMVDRIGSSDDQHDWAVDTTAVCCMFTCSFTHVRDSL